MMVISRRMRWSYNQPRGNSSKYFNSHKDCEWPGKVKQCAEVYADEMANSFSISCNIPLPD